MSSKIGLEIRVNDLTILVNGSPQLILLTIEFYKDFLTTLTTATLTKNSVAPFIDIMTVCQQERGSAVHTFNPSAGGFGR